jgi:hypothetical protein
VLDPTDPRTKDVVKQIGVLVVAMPAHRTFTPDADVLARAALLSGMLCQLQGYQKDARLRALHDCVLFLQAQKLGFAVLTANIADFDYLLQLVPPVACSFTVDPEIVGPPQADWSFSRRATATAKAAAFLRPLR